MAHNPTTQNSITHNLASLNPTSSPEIFLEMSEQFRLGDLPTEQSHPLTQNLSELARTDVSEAVRRLKQIDLQALVQLKNNSAYVRDLQSLRQNIEFVLEQGRRVFLCGCGATGRLSLTLEALWRQTNPESDAVVSFMAGGDVALVHAIEGFEDHPDFGARQLLQLGFTEDDLLICCTEGGETPFVIGAALQAAEISRHPVAFLFCNPQSLLEQKLERCRQVLQHPNVQAIEVNVGPMALSGSTRLQASSVLMLSVGLALFGGYDEDFKHDFEGLERWLAAFDFSQLEDFIRAEADLYRAGRSVVYQVEDFAISVFTDTTERAPTFSLRAFQPQTTKDELPSWSFIEHLQSRTSLEAWENILRRPPRSLNWSDINPKTADDYLESFDFSAGALNRRASRWPSVQFESFKIAEQNGILTWELLDLTARFDMGDAPPLYRHLLVKMLLNIHSTLLMGRLGRYEGNWMTYVFPTNAKLIDRAARYVLGILKREGRNKSYEDVVRALFKKLPYEKKDSSIVLELVNE